MMVLRYCGITARTLSGVTITAMPPALLHTLHYLIPLASVGSEGRARAWDSLQLPHLDKLLERMALQPVDVADEYTLSPPHERALAQHMGLWAGDGKTPWAAHELSNSQAFGYQNSQAWATITPCFWHVGVDQIQMLHPDGLHLTEEDSRTVLEAVRPYFAEDGIMLHYDSPTRWFVQSPLFDGLATASLDRVVGRNVNAWMPEGAQAAPLRRLQNEMQMLLYTHPVNDRRQAAGLLAVNSFWVSGAGALPADIPAQPSITVLDDLHTPALHENWDSWSAAWQQLDSTVLKDLSDKAWRGERFELILCGERAAQHWRSFSPTLAQRLKHPFIRLLGQQPERNLLNQL